MKPEKFLKSIAVNILMAPTNRRYKTKNVHEDSACSACYASLVRALNVNERGLKENIYIGQGWRGKKIPDGALGIGRCCSGADRNVKGCPPDARSIAEMF